MELFDHYTNWWRGFASPNTGDGATRIGKLPPYMWPGILRYIEFGSRPGRFLCAVISNDLYVAATTADDKNSMLLVNYIRFFGNSAPAECWGSPEKLEAWVERGGLEGIK